MHNILLAVVVILGLAFCVGAMILASAPKVYIYSRGDKESAKDK